MKDHQLVLSYFILFVVAMLAQACLSYNGFEPCSALSDAYQVKETLLSIEYRVAREFIDTTISLLDHLF
ncbi:MAG: hypothetical protein R3275_08405 [Saprospiraceae bacterium]|nr:hypothetical protein [Saprospiraceae bacterium]